MQRINNINQPVQWLEIDIGSGTQTNFLMKVILGKVRFSKAKNNRDSNPLRQGLTRNGK